MTDPEKAASPVLAVDEPRFVRFVPLGRVHVMKGYRKLDLLVGESFGDRLAESVMARQRAYCGTEGRPGLQYGLSMFDDADLCHRCVRAWPHDSTLLFEHATQENTDLPVLIDWRATNRNAQTNTPPMRGEVFDDGRVETWLTPDNTEIPLQCAPPWTLAPANTDSPGSP